MQHADVRERLELAALEPGGLDRLTAGDAPDAAALAGHLAGCQPCLQELDRLRRSTAILRGVIAAEPPAELRERTLAFVRELGVPRGSAPAGVAGTAPAGVAGTVSTGVEMPIGGGRPPLESERVSAGTQVAVRRRDLRRPAAWIASIAAAVILSVVATTALLGVANSEEVEALAKVASWNVGIASSADGQRIPLKATAGTTATAARGELSFARSTGALVVVVRDLAAPAGDREYRCWLQAPDGTRTRVGRMDFAGGIAYWFGNVPALAQAGPGTTFGIWLVDRGADPAGAAALAGEL
jgi:hypothetical protein